MKNKNKRGALGEGVLMIYRLMLVSLVAFTVLGLSAVFYSHYIDIRDVEAQILTRNVVDCLAPEGLLNLDLISEDKRERVLSYCGFGAKEIERFYVLVEVEDLEGNTISRLEQGDSGAKWIRELFERVSSRGGDVGDIGPEEVGKYRPGSYENSYFMIVQDLGELKEGKIIVEVLVNNEF